MIRKLIKSRRGVSGAISGVFVMLICFLALTAIFVYAISLDRYNQVVNERSELNWEIDTEKFAILDGQRNSDGALNLTVFNYGAVTAHIVDVWVTHKNSSGSWQELYETHCWMNPAETIQNFGEQNVTLLPNGIQCEGINLTQPVVAGINYTVKLVSERGNTVSYLIKYDPPLCPETEGQPVPFIITWTQESFEFRSLEHDLWAPAWVKQRQVANQHQIYRINLTNVSGRNIILNQSSHMRQESDDMADNEAVWWISDPSTEPSQLKPTPFNVDNPQSVNNGESAYVYLASATEHSDTWSGDPNVNRYYTVFIHIFFNFEGEDTFYGHTIGIMGQKLYD